MHSDSQQRNESAVAVVSCQLYRWRRINDGVMMAQVTLIQSQLLPEYKKLLFGSCPQSYKEFKDLLEKANIHLGLDTRRRSSQP